MQLFKHPLTDKGIEAFLRTGKHQRKQVYSLDKQAYLRLVIKLFVQDRYSFKTEKQISPAQRWQ